MYRFLFLFCLINYPCSSQIPSIISGISHIKEIPLPQGYERINPEINSFAAYLQNLEIDTAKENVLLYDGSYKSNQNAHFAILKMDVGNKDLQQCADAIIRLRAEYLYQTNEIEKIHFNFSSGDTAKYINYRDGFRASFDNNIAIWEKRASFNSSYENFRKYLDLVFTYAGTYSLNKELKSVNNVNNLKIGDIFIQTGNPYGHAVIVVDMAIHPLTHEKIFLVAQSYMPAQDIHILKNYHDSRINPWYKLDSTTNLNTPEWVFSYDNLKRFKEE